MFKHHAESIEKLKAKLADREDILALLISGSIAHGFAKASSDVDVMMVVSDKEYARRLSTGELTYWENEVTEYESGYVDGKYISYGFLQQVVEKGSEPARFAFEGAIPFFSKVDGLEELLAEIVRYPVERKQENIARFLAQLEAWKWYSAEAFKHDNLYLLQHSVNNLVLFGGRLILAHNEMLYPYHKWFLKVLENAPHKPHDLLGLIDRMLKAPTADHIEEFYQSVKTFTDWGSDGRSWPSRFMEDSELNWLHGYTPVNDI
ncbi:MAG: nucleotidyltransferase domain-containing protein [Paenibacillus macerans]|uniref:Nucleotidyltransferase domain protein n=1 Tax=Paenibacillus macerans TaxID=44252 RepID=A0A090ZIL4_PAEMA|nr:nucleotidyltransferase domain-containing protein [Paenibacillus macerans]KFN10477.1 nucleotidyltransferase domain protein [Paenibacillus macerans]MBS5912270.1 nucleotidyltransferase domain-containing protein [Paenibacillus macerans]MCY7562775.1 nucleotidyltransferase domain-containing protein [Paenibacillus macerans]MDU7476055.1 nucleotidyltransferase domain-containing protein [Paenibacillus macerans]MEC0138525.1 nucleotidyltransferase domain-containing protein [Paenibacillus macerans]